MAAGTEPLYTRSGRGMGGQAPPRRRPEDEEPRRPPVEVDDRRPTGYASQPNQQPDSSNPQAGGREPARRTPATPSPGGYGAVYDANRFQGPTEPPTAPADEPRRIADPLATGQDEPAWARTALNVAGMLVPGAGRGIIEAREARRQRRLDAAQNRRREERLGMEQRTTDVRLDIAQSAEQRAQEQWEQRSGLLASEEQRAQERFEHNKEVRAARFAWENRKRRQKRQADQLEAAANALTFAAEGDMLTANALTDNPDFRDFLRRTTGMAELPDDVPLRIVRQEKLNEDGESVQEFRVQQQAPNPRTGQMEWQDMRGRGGQSVVFDPEDVSTIMRRADPDYQQQKLSSMRAEMQQGLLDEKKRIQQNLLELKAKRAEAANDEVATELQIRIDDQRRALEQINTQLSVLESGAALGRAEDVEATKAAQAETDRELAEQTRDELLPIVKETRRAIAEVEREGATSRKGLATLKNTLDKLNAALGAAETQAAMERAPDVEATKDIQASMARDAAEFEQDLQPTLQTIRENTITFQEETQEDRQKVASEALGRKLSGARAQTMAQAYLQGQVNPDLGMDYVRNSGLFEFKEGQEPVRLEMNHGDKGNQMALVDAEGNVVSFDSGQKAVFDKSALNKALGTEGEHWRSAAWGMYNTKTGEVGLLTGESGKLDADVRGTLKMMEDTLASYYGGQYSSELEKYIIPEENKAQYQEALELAERMYMGGYVTTPYAASRTARRYTDAAAEEGISAVQYWRSQMAALAGEQPEGGIPTQGRTGDQIAEEAFRQAAGEAGGQEEEPRRTGGTEPFAEEEPGRFTPEYLEQREARRQGESGPAESVSRTRELRNWAANARQTQRGADDPGTTMAVIQDKATELGLRGANRRAAVIAAGRDAGVPDSYLSLFTQLAEE